MTDQDREDRRKHLELIQGVVNRLANASATIKGWSVTVAGAAFGVAVVRDNWYLWVLGLAALVAFGALDVHYLKAERDYRNLHLATINDHIPPFCLDPREIPKSALPAGQKPPHRSWSVTKFYLPLIVAGLVLTTVALLSDTEPEGNRAQRHHDAEHHRHAKSGRSAEKSTGPSPTAPAVETPTVQPSKGRSKGR